MIKVSFSDWNFRHGMDCISGKDYESAAGYLRKAAESGHPDAQYNLGEMYAKGLGVPRDNGKALKWLGKAAIQGHAEAERELGVLKAERNAPGEEAQAGKPAAGKVFSRDSGNPSAGREEPLEELYRQGLKEKDSGNFAGAIALWKRVLERDFHHLNAINAIACVYAQAGRLEMAEKYIDLAMKVGGDRTDFVRANLAGIYFGSSRFKEAEEVLGTIRNKDARTTGNLTRVLCAQGNVEKALELIEEFLSREGSAPAPDAAGDRNVLEIVMRGLDCLLELSPYDAVDYLEDYSRLLPPELKGIAYFNAGIRFLQEEGDGVTALTCLAEAAKSDPGDAEIREARLEAARMVIEELEDREKIFNYEKQALDLARETVGRGWSFPEADAEDPPDGKETRGERKPVFTIVSAGFLPKGKPEGEMEGPERKKEGPEGKKKDPGKGANR
jgi:tetratricopeptide (TPR) repeat protein